MWIASNNIKLFLESTDFLPLFKFNFSKNDSLFQVMKDWSDLEERYQDMRSEDTASAEDFKKQMTERFQKTVQV